MSAWISEWQTKEYMNAKITNFNIVDAYLNFSPKRILDIGCGLAYESQWFQEKYTSELFLVDGNFETKKRQIKYGPAEDFGFYTDINQLISYWDGQGLNYNFIDATNPYIKPDIKFDLVYSFLSCGFHYPANTYKEFIQKHTDENSTIIMDLRFVTKQSDIEIVDIIHEDRKSQKAVIKFIDS